MHRHIDHNVSCLLYMIVHHLSIHISHYLIRLYNRTLSFFWVGFCRIDLELSDDTTFGMIGPVFLG